MVLVRAIRSVLVLALVLTGSGVLTAQPHGPALTVERDRFAVDGKPRGLYFVSFFDGVREAIASPTRLDEDLSYIRQTLGADGIRVFPNWWVYEETGDLTTPRWVGPGGDTLFDPSNPTSPLRPAQLAALKHLLQRASATGLVVDVSFTIETLPAPGMTFDAYKAALVAAARELKAFRNVLFDLQNEYDDDPRLTAVEMQELRAAVNAPEGDPRRLVVASPTGLSPAENGAFAATSGMSAVAHHDAREAPTWYLDKTLVSIASGIRSGTGNKPLPIYLQEPMPWSSKGDEDRTAGHFLAAAQHAKRAGIAAWTFHQRLGFILTATSFKAKVARLPDLKNELERVGRKLREH